MPAFFLLEVHMQTLSVLRRKPHMSISALKSFLTCPRRYRLQYIDRVRPDFYPAALALGSAWHEVLAVWLTGRAEDEKLEELLRERIRASLLEAEIPVLFDDEDETEDSFLERAARMLKTFGTSVPRPKVVLGTEIAFSTEIADPATGELLPVPVIGALDAVVVEQDGRGSLWEFKTSARRYSSTAGAVDHDAQLTLYKKAARELGFDGIRLRYLVTTKTKEPAVQVLDVERTDADERELVELFFAVHRAIDAGVDYRQRGWACSSCAYAGACR